MLVSSGSHTGPAGLAVRGSIPAVAMRSAGASWVAASAWRADCSRRGDAKQNSTAGHISSFQANASARVW
jgi:hypothetical protein